VRGYVDIGVDEGDARHRRPPVAGHIRWVLRRRDVVRSRQPSMRIYREEIFGPVLSVVRVSTFDEALQLVNDHEYGNGTAIFTRDGDAARAFTSGVQGRHGRRQRADSGADGLPLVRRLEAIPVRGPQRARARRRALLYASENDHGRWPKGVGRAPISRCPCSDSGFAVAALGLQGARVSVAL
jgi:malonate-semialdehyde dehydrogenase (acetylating)/methylmalonate-semialdehyde dehydrogenase